MIPTFSVDQQWAAERQTSLFGRAVTQTLEPRLQYVYTPYRDQAQLPLFDSAAKDFNRTSIYDANAFAGGDRVADANHFDGGIMTRFVDAQTGAETLRLGLVQRYLLADQRITPGDGAPLTQAWSDALLYGSTSVVPNWNFQLSAQYNHELERTVRSSMGMHYQPGDHRNLSLRYLYTRTLSEQVDLAWQWPLPWLGSAATKVTGGPSSCRGDWYGLGRVNYSLRESRVTDSVLGLEYDSGCWIARVLASRLSTGRSEGVTRVGFEIEFVGLSSRGLGTNPVKVLKDNIPGYQTLRRRATIETAP